MRHLPLFLAAPLVTGLAFGCTLANAPDDIRTSGAGGAGTGAGSSSGGGGEHSGYPSSSHTGGPHVPFCGDGLLDPREECDDGNDAAGDACSVECKITEFDVEKDADIVNEWPGIGTSGVDNGGGFLVSWRHMGPTSDPGDDAIRARAYQQSGARAFEAPLTLSTTSHPSQARMGTNGSGRSVVAWQSGSEGNSIRYRVIQPDASLAKPTDEHFADPSEILVSVGASASGEFALVWQQQVMDTHPVVTRCLDADGNQPAGTFAHQLGDAGFSYPGVWGRKTGFTVSAAMADGTLNAYALDVGANVVGPQFVLATNNGSYNPSGAYIGPDEQFIAVFERLVDVGSGPKLRIMKRFFTAPMNSPEVEQVVSSSDISESGARVARHANGRLLVVWSEDNCVIKARLLSPTGTPLGPVFQVTQVDEGCQSGPGVAVNASGDAMFVWNNDTGTGPVRVSGILYPRLLVK